MSLFSKLKAAFTPAPRLTANECMARVKSGDAMLVDVREPNEWTGGIARGAALLPLSDLTGARQQWKKFLAEIGGREVLVYCASGGRSRMAASLLINEGYRAANAGGMAEWASAGWPIVNPSSMRK